MEKAKLEFKSIIEDDLIEITEIMMRAFDDDARQYQGKEKGGPEGYDNGEFFRKWLFGYDESTGFKIILDSNTIGAMILWIFSDGKNLLGNIFIDPDIQNRGVGSQVWSWIEAKYPETKSWSLETHHKSIRNHHFYEKKCGFTKIKEQDDQWIFKKRMR